MSTFEHIEIDRVGTDGRVARVTLNRPEKMNSLSQELLFEFSDALHDLEADESARVIIVRGAGRTFSAGYDLAPARGGADAVVRRYRGVDDQRRRLLMGTRTGMQQITDIHMYFWNMAKVTIAQVHGYALAGGCELAMMADLVVAAEDAQFGHPGLRGLGTSRTGVIWPLVIGMRKAKELYYTGDSISGAEAERIGMINYAWPKEDLESHAIGLADRLANATADHLAILKLNMNRFYENMGIYSSVRSSTDMDAMAQMTSFSYAWQDKMRESNEAGTGLKGALDWREGMYRKPTPGIEAVKGLLIGVHSTASTAQKTVDAIIAAEKAGIQCSWLTVGGVAPDPFAIFGAAAQHTRTIKFGTSIVPTFPRHPLAMAQGALAVDSLAPGRMRLGVGPSHKPAIEGTWGIPFERPLQHLREYLTILRGILETGAVNFEGKRLTARAQIAGPTRVTVMASALRINGFRLVGELADGAISWNCPLPYLRDVAIPALKEGAARAGRPAPPLVAHVPVVVSEDEAAVREGARRQIGFYPRVPFYSQMLQDAGFPEAKDGELSDRMVDALVIHGSASRVKDRLRSLPEFGASELLAMPILPPGDTGAMERTLETLGELARE